MPARFSADTPVNTMLGNTETTLAFAGGGSATSPSPRAAASLNHWTAARSSEPVPTPCPSANGRIHRVDAAPRRSALEQGKRALGVALQAPTFHQPKSEHVVAAPGPRTRRFLEKPDDVRHVALPAVAFDQQRELYRRLAMTLVRGFGEQRAPQRVLPQCLPQSARGGSRTALAQSRRAPP